jgi:hypothetical protein
MTATAFTFPLTDLLGLWVTVLVAYLFIRAARRLRRRS